MRGLRIVEVAPGVEGALEATAALRARLHDDGPAVALVPTPSRHVTPGYAAAARAALDDAAHGVPDDIAAVVSTSGSTGHPRGVLISADNLRSCARAADLARPGLADCTWVLALPVTSIGGLNVVARSVLNGSNPKVLTSVGGAASFRAEDLLAVSGSEPFAVSVVPTQLRAILDVEAAAEWLGRAHTVLVGGAAAPEGLLRQARAAGIAAVTTYGMTESTGGCVFDGVPLPDVRVDVTPEGRIRLGGPTIAHGYVAPGPEDGFEDGDGRWFATSDVGSWDGSTLRITGRADDIVTVHGVNVSLGAVEQALLAASGVEQAAVVAAHDAHSGNQVIAFVVLDGTADTAALTAAVTSKLGGAARPRIVRADSLPHLPNGKIDRLALRTAAEQGKG